MISRIIQMLLWNLLDNFMEFLKLFLNLTDTFMWKVERQFIWIWSWTSELNDSLDPLILRNFGWFNSTCVRFLTGNFKTAIIYSGHVLFVIWNDPAHSNDKQNQSSNVAYNCWYLKSQEGLSRLAFLFRTVENYSFKWIRACVFILVFVQFAAPDDFPRIHVTSKTLTSLTVKWDKLSIYHRCGVISGYTLVTTLK